MKSKARAAISVGGRLVRQDQVRENALRQVREGLRQPLAGEQRLARMLQHDRIAGDQRRDDRVDRSQKRIVPRRNDEDDPERLARDRTPEPLAVLDPLRRQRLVRDRGHVVGPLAHPAHLAAIANRPTHLPREFGDDVGVELAETLDALAHERDAPVERAARPVLLRGARGVDAGARGGGGFGGARRIDAGVDGRNAGDRVGHRRFLGGRAGARGGLNARKSRPGRPDGRARRRRAPGVSGRAPSVSAGTSSIAPLATHRASMWSFRSATLICVAADEGPLADLRLDRASPERQRLWARRWRAARRASGSSMRIVAATFWRSSSAASISASWRAASYGSSGCSPCWRPIRRRIALVWAKTPRPAISSTGAEP